MGLGALSGNGKRLHKIVDDLLMVRYKNSIFQFVCHPSKMVCVQTRRRLCLYIFVSDNDRGLPLSPSVTAVDNDLRSLARTLHVANPPPPPPTPPRNGHLQKDTSEVG